MQLSRIQDELESLKAELWEYVEDEETDLQTDIKETMNYLLDLIDDLMICQKIQEEHDNKELNDFQKEWIKERCNTNTPPTNIPEPPSKSITKTIVNLSIDEFRGLIKEAVTEEFAKHSYINPTYIPVQPYYCPNYPTGPYCGKDITYTVDTKTTPIIKN